MQLLQFTDTHLLGPPGSMVRGVDTGESLARCLAHARLRYPAAEALLMTGDLVQDDPAGYGRLRELLADSSLPVHCLAGNHDLHEAMQAELAAPPFVLDAVNVYGDWLLLMLDTTVPGAAHGHLDDGQLALLDQTLALHSARHALICLHHQPVTHGSRWLDELMLDNADDLFQTLAPHPAARCLLWGHVHQSLDQDRDGLRLLATPSTCMQFLPRSDEFAVDALPPAYRWLTLQPDGGIRTGLEWVPAVD